MYKIVFDIREVFQTDISHFVNEVAECLYFRRPSRRPAKAMIHIRTILVLYREG